MNWSDFLFGFVSGAFACLFMLSFAAWRTMRPLLKAQQGNAKKAWEKGVG